MSSSLALASVTAVLKHLLENGLVDRGITAIVGADTVVSALPPDRIATGAEEHPQLNLFLYQVTPNANLRTKPHTSDPSNQVTSSTRPLALDLHYMLTAYGAHDLHIEILLGYALQIFHENPVMQGETIRTALASISSIEGGRTVPPTLAALGTFRAADQVQDINIRPLFLNAEDTGKLWSSLQARYRPSANYKVSLVLIDHG